MIYLLLSVLITTFLFSLFKLFEKYEVNTFHAIVVNYVVCVITGFAFSDPKNLILTENDYQWVVFPMLVGGIFIVAFYLIAETAQRVSVAAASISSKISMVIPILVSLFVLGNNSKEFTFLNYLGLFLSIFAVYFSSYKDKQLTHKTKSIKSILLPLGVFLLSGIADVIMNYANATYMQADDAELFTILTFAFSGIIGLIVLLYQLIILKSKLKIKSIIAGVVLGVPNFFSILFLVNALTAFNNDGALMYPINNMGIILCSLLVGIFFFKERLNQKNRIGVGLSIVAIILISYQELLNV